LELFHQLGVFKPNGFHFIAQIFLDALKSIDITIADHAERTSRSSGTARSTNAVNVVFGIIG